MLIAKHAAVWGISIQNLMFCKSEQILINFVYIIN